MEHRLIWEDAFGSLPQGSYLHHANADKSDNRINNLILVASNSEHHRLFHAKRPTSHGAAVSNALKGRPKSPEHRAKIAAAHRGKAKSPEHKVALSASLKGRPRPDISAMLKGKTRLLTTQQRRALAAAANLHRSLTTGQFI